MTPRRPHLLLVPALLLALVGPSGCGEGTVATATGSTSPGPTSSAPPSSGPPSSGQTTPPQQQAPAPDDRLPDDLDLGHGLDRSEQWSDFGLEGPGREVEGVPMVDFCSPDPTTWPGTVADRMAVRETGPEYEQSREALLYPDAPAARRALDGLRALVAGCPEVAFRAGEESPEDRLHLLLEPTGEDVVTIGVHYRGVLGSGAYQVRRVGRTLLAARDLGEGNRDSLEEQAANLTTALDGLLAQIGDDLP